MQIILGVAYGVIFVILLALGSFFIYIGFRLVASVREFSELLEKQAESLEREMGTSRSYMKDAQQESEKLRNAMLPFSESMHRTADALLAVTKGFDRFDQMRSALETNSAVAKQMIEISDKVSKDLRAAAEVGALICSTIIRGSSVRGGPGEASISFTAPPPGPDVQPEAEPQGDFHTYSEESAAENEKIAMARAAGVVIDESPEQKVPLEQMNKAGES